METLISTHAIESVREVWWDIRPHPGLRHRRAAHLRRAADARRDRRGRRAVAVPGRAVRHPARPRLHAADAGAAGCCGRTSGAPPATGWTPTSSSTRRAPSGRCGRRSSTWSRTSCRRRGGSAARPSSPTSSGSSPSAPPTSGSGRSPPRTTATCGRSSTACSPRCATGCRAGRARRDGRRGEARRHGQPVVEKLGAAVDDWVAAHHAAAGRRPAGTCTPTPSWPSPSSRPPPSSSSGCARAGSQPRRLPTGTGLVVRGRAPATRSSCCAPTSTRCRWPTSRTCPTPPPARASATPAGTTCTPPSLLGVALALATLDGLPGTVRCVFQPAEETVPGGAHRGGRLRRAGRRLPGLRAALRPVGAGRARSACAPAPITAACDRIDVTLTGPGGHTARPQLTVDLVDALGRLITDLPGAAVPAGRPAVGHVAGLGRGQRRHRGQRDPAARHAARHACGCWTATLWKDAEELMRSLVERVAATTGAEVRRRLRPRRAAGGQRPARGRAAARRRAGDGGQRPAWSLSPQSMGGEDFGWFAEVHADRAGPARHARRRAAAGPAPRHLRRRRAGDRGRRPADGAHRAARAGGRRGTPRAPARPRALGTLLPDAPSTRGGNPTMSSTDQQS